MDDVKAVMAAKKFRDFLFWMEKETFWDSFPEEDF